jgi:ABC-type glucose/galactose transport system permease subunit
VLFIKNPAGGSVWRSAIVIRDPLFSASLNRLPNRESFSYTIPTLATPNIGGVSFDGGLIQLFGQGDLNTYSIFGSISYPTASEINKQLKKSSSTSE